MGASDERSWLDYFPAYRRRIEPPALLLGPCRRLHALQEGLERVAGDGKRTNRESAILFLKRNLLTGRKAELRRDIARNAHAQAVAPLLYRSHSVYIVYPARVPSMSIKCK